MQQPGAPLDPRRWLILAVVGLAQLMVVLDTTIVNIALPSAQRSLGFSNDSRQWIITGYALSFGGLLLLGGRLGDIFGRKRVFIIGLIGFATASGIGGVAPSFIVLVSARALQGAFGALLAPAALSLLTTTFTESSERNKAFGVYGAIVGAVGAIGLHAVHLRRPGRWRGAACRVRVLAGPGGQPAAAAPGGAGPQPRWRLPGPC